MTTQPMILGQCRECDSRGRYEGVVYSAPEDEEYDMPTGAQQVGTTIMRQGVFVFSKCCNAFLDVVACPYDGQPGPPAFDGGNLAAIEIFGGPDDGATFPNGCGPRIAGAGFEAEGHTWAPTYELREFLMYDDSPQGWYYKRMYAFTGHYSITKLH